LQYSSVRLQFIQVTDNLSNIRIHAYCLLVSKPSQSKEARQTAWLWNTPQVHKRQQKHSLGTARVELVYRQRQSYPSIWWDLFL